MTVEEILAKANMIRHEGLKHENAGRLAEAENHYDEALRLYRQHDKTDTLGYANAVRYPAVVKNLLGKRDEATKLWREAFDRYEKIGIAEGMVEAAAWLTIFAIESNDLPSAQAWYAKASMAASRSEDADTRRFIEDVGKRLELAGG